jgi:hypothetical protein
MTTRWVNEAIALCGALLISAVVVGQGAQGGQRGISAADQKNANKTYDKRDLAAEAMVAEGPAATVAIADSETMFRRSLLSVRRCLMRTNRRTVEI